MKALNLEGLNACEEALKWYGSQNWATLEEAWNNCPRGDWLLWLCAKLDIDRKLLVRSACSIARTVLKYVPAGEDRPLKAIEAAEAWCAGKATLQQVQAAAEVAWVAAEVARVAGAAWAAWVAANKEHADIVRNFISFSVVFEAFEAREKGS